MKKFLWGFMPYLVVSILFFVAIGGGEALVPASGESWFFPWTWSLDETRSMVVAGLNGLATITTLSFVGLGVLVASTPAVEAKATDFLTKREASKDKDKDEGEVWNGEEQGRAKGYKNPAQAAPSKEATGAVTQGSTFVESNN